MKYSDLTLIILKQNNFNNKLDWKRNNRSKLELPSWLGQ